MLKKRETKSCVSKKHLMDFWASKTPLTSSKIIWLSYPLTHNYLYFQRRNLRMKNETKAYSQKHNQSLCNKNSQLKMYCFQNVVSYHRVFFYMHGHVFRISILQGRRNFLRKAILQSRYNFHKSKIWRRLSQMWGQSIRCWAAAS